MKEQIEHKTQEQTDKDNAIDYIYDLIKEVIIEVHQKVDGSQKLYKLGSEDELADIVKKMLGSPLDIITTLFDKQLIYFYKMMQKIVSEFLSKHKDKIAKTYIVNEEHNKLHYAIILNKDNYKERAGFYKFLKRYDDCGISNSFPIVFQFVSPKLEDKLNKVKEIALS